MVLKALLHFSRTFNELAHVAVYSETDADLYVFLTISHSQYLNGLVPKIGSVCDYSRHKRVSISRYQHGDAETAMVIKVIQKWYVIIRHRITPAPY